VVNVLAQAKPVGHGAALQPSIPTPKQSSLLTLIATTEHVVVRADEKLTAFVELESAIRAIFDVYRGGV
jgi:hypothetical protein